MPPLDPEEFVRRLHARARPKSEPEEATAGREEDAESRDKTMPPMGPQEPSFPPPGADVDLTRSTGGFIGLGSLLARKLAPLRFLVAHLLVDEGGGFIAGEEKAGKTLFALHIALCMVLGLPVGGHFAVPDKLCVLFIEEEDSLRRTWRRIRKMLRGFGLDPDDQALQAELNDHFRISVWSGVDLDDPVWWDRIATEVEAHRPDVVFFDPLSKLTAHNLNKAEEARPLLNRLDALRRRFGFAVLLLHHYRKQQGERAGRGSQEIAGSFTLGAWAEQSLFLEPKDRTGKLVTLTLQSKDVDILAPLRVVIVETEGEAGKITTTLEDLPTAAGTQERVWEAMGTAPPSEPHSGLAGVSMVTLEKALKLSNKTIRLAMADLIRSGRVLEVGKTTKGAKLYAQNA
jgi:KaiC/GvpD/RAD55 family RecA-like ATPase